MAGRFDQRQRGAPAVLAGLILTLLVGCSSVLPSPTPAPTTPSAASAPTASSPAEPFPALSGRSVTGARTHVYDVAATPGRVVSVGQYYDGITSADIAFSNDGGVTWQRAAVPPGPGIAAETAIDVAGRTEGSPAWLALGEDTHDRVAWTSTDGITWTRNALASEVFDEDQDEVLDLYADVNGFVAVGYSVVEDKEQPRVWRSRDGIAWSEERLPGPGNVNALAIRDGITVAVGEKDDDWRVWRSTGKGWSRVNRITRPPGDGDFNRDLSAVTVHSGEFWALGSAYIEGQEYQPVLYRSRDGRSWSYDPGSAALGADGNGRGVGLYGDGAEMYAVINLRGSVDRHRVLALRNGGWQETEGLVPGSGRIQSTIWGLAPTGAGWVAVGNRSVGEATTAHRWVSSGGPVFHSSTPPPPVRDRPVIQPSVILATDRSVRVLGRAQDTVAIWTQTPDGSMATPTAVPLDPGARVDGAVANASTVLVYGKASPGDSEHALVWTGSEGRSWPTTRPGTFERITTYSSSTIHRIRRLGSTWFAVGERSRNGDLNSSALLFSSSDGRTWRAAEPARTLKKPGGDVWYPVTDLNGDHDRRRTMHDITRTTRGYLAAGSVAENGPDRAAVWRSTDGRRWRFEILGARGFAESKITWAATLGQRTVLFGWARSKGDKDSTPYLWSSTDGGRTFRGQTSGAPGDVDVELVVTDKEFVIAGADELGSRPPWFQRSADGRSWKPLLVSGYQVGPDETAWPVDLEAVGRDLLVLMHMTDHTGDRHLLLRQPLL